MRADHVLRVMLGKTQFILWVCKSNNPALKISLPHSHIAKRCCRNYANVKSVSYSCRSCSLL